MSPSSRRAWIEISARRRSSKLPFVALLAEGVDRNALVASALIASLTSPSSRRAWIEIRLSTRHRHGHQSPSSRRAWIEISLEFCDGLAQRVALLAEGVDRNAYRDQVRAHQLAVALLAEGVDRNICAASSTLTSSVALLAEGVDRNRFPSGFHRAGHVALLAEGVDRNSR